MVPLPIDESTVNPHAAYGISKYSLELAGKHLGSRYGIPTVSMRYSIVQGPRNSFYSFSGNYSDLCGLGHDVFCCGIVAEDLSYLPGMPRQKT